MSFTAYIASFLPLDNLELRNSRSAITKRQIQWWLEKTSITINVIAMNYTDEDFLPDNPRLNYMRNPPMKLTPARKVGFDHFYASDYDFAIMMDDDAILYDKPQHNLGPKLFEEMSEQIHLYSGVDVFFPINPQKIGFNPIWNKDPTKYKDNHVFKRSMDLKGSMFVVRNFTKFNKVPVYPDLDFNWQEDTKFAIDCVAEGHTVLQSHNLVLHELSGKASHFAAAADLRIPRMLDGNTRIAQQYESLGLRMEENSHLLDRKEFMKRCWKNSQTEFVIPRPGSNLANLFDFGA
jgi:hypothetical protein